VKRERCAFGNEDYLTKVFEGDRTGIANKQGRSRNASEADEFFLDVRLDSVECGSNKQDRRTSVVSGAVSKTLVGGSFYGRRRI